MIEAAESSTQVTATTLPIAKRPPSVRNKLANGSKFLPLTDGRSATARRFCDLIEDISADLGGASQLSEGQRQLVRRAAMLSAEGERLEAVAARGEGFDVDVYGALCDRLGRVFARIGLKRVPRDATTLSDYIGKARLPVEIAGDADAGAP